MFEQNYKSSVTHNSFQFILFIIEKLKYRWNVSYLVRDLTFENSSFMSLATTFSLYMALAPSVHIAKHFGQGISCSRKKLSITLKISELFFTSRQLLKKKKFLLHLILVDKSQKS